jgi:hypothetical protein
MAELSPERYALTTTEREVGVVLLLICFNLDHLKSVSILLMLAKIDGPRKKKGKKKRTANLIEQSFLDH